MAKKASVRDAATLTTYLESMGYTVKKISGTKVAILTNDSRESVLADVAKRAGARWDRTPRSDSSVGRVVISGISVLAKPASKQGGASAGVGNETVMVNTINRLCRTGPMNVIFKESASKRYAVRGCAGARSVGADTAGRKKADVILFDARGREYPVSLKKDDAEMWESADSYWGEKALALVERAVRSGKASVTPQGGYFTLEPNVALRATTAETRDVVFGSDLANGGAIITRTFAPADFKVKDDTVTVTVTDIITEMRDVNGGKQVYFLVRNDKTRRSITKYPGLRVLAVYEARINSRVLVL